MDNLKDNHYFINKALNEINIIIDYAQRISYEDFLSDAQLIDAVMFRLIQLIEHIKNLSDDFKLEHSNIPWGDIVGFRNRIVHEYGETDYSVVYEVISKDLFPLKELFESCLE